MLQRRGKQPVRGGRASRDDWTAAALTALTERGVKAVAVEPLAAVLGATKGSFYWHFSDRAELLGATLDLWEHVATPAVVARLTEIDEPTERLRVLFGMTFGSSANGRVDVALMAARDDPMIAEVLVRVTTQRTDTAWIGLAQLQHAVPSAVPTGVARARYLDHLLAALTSQR